MRKWSLLSALILFGMTNVLAACVANTTETVRTISNYCQIAAPITFSSTKDSAETRAQIERHNSQWECVCNKDCPHAPETGAAGAIQPPT